MLFLLIILFQGCLGKHTISWRTGEIYTQKYESTGIQWDFILLYLGYKHYYLSFKTYSYLTTLVPWTRSLAEWDTNYLFRIIWLYRRDISYKTNENEKIKEWILINMYLMTWNWHQFSDWTIRPIPISEGQEHDIWRQAMQKNMHKLFENLKRRMN